MNELLPHVGGSSDVDPHATLQLVGHAVSVLTGLDTTDGNGGLSPQNEQQLMREWTGAEHTGTWGAETNQDGPGQVWRVLREALPAPETQVLHGTPDATLVLGASGDIMYNHALLLARSTGYKPQEIWYLAGMRPAGTQGDKHFAQAFGLEPDTLSQLSESDIAALIIERVHGAELIHEDSHPVSAIEVPNELGPRRWSHRYYHTPDGQNIILLNGASVERRGGGKPRHISESVFQEFAETAQLPTAAQIDLFATYPHAERATLELHMALTKLSIDAHVGTVSVMPPTDRMTPQGLLAALMPLYRVSKEAIALNVRTSRLAVLRPQENAEGSELRDSVFDAVRQRAINALLEIGPATYAGEARPQATLESYVIGTLGNITERRCDADEPIFTVPEARRRFVGLMEQLGANETSTIGPDDLRLATGSYLYFSEGGSSAKIVAQLDMLVAAKSKPGITILSGSLDREITSRDEINHAAALLGIMPDQVGKTEYELHRQMAQQRIVQQADERQVGLVYDIAKRNLRPVVEGERPDFEMLGRDADGGPVILMANRRTPSAEPGKTYTNLGPTGSLVVMADMLARPEIQSLCRGTKLPDTVCFASSTLYAPTRTLALLDARADLAKHGSDARLCLALYGRSTDKPWMAQMSSELRHLLRVVLDWETAATSAYRVSGAQQER